MEIKDNIRAVSVFLKNGVWIDPKGAGPIRMLMLYAIRIILITVKGLNNKMLMLRASALAYSTILAVVPLLAIGFSMMKGLGFESRIEHILLKYLTAEQEGLSQRILGYIANTDFKALGAFGTAILIYAVIMMLGNVEKTFNDLWGVTRARRFVRKVSDYISVLLLGPILMVVASAMIASLSSNTVVVALSRYPVFKNFFVLFHTVLPHAVLWIAFTAMYMMMPNTRVKFLPAFIAGMLCGSLWEVAFRAYTYFNIGVTNYNKIYGTFAALPIFIIWIYISWIIVLIGAQLSNAIQHIRAYQQEFASITASAKERETIAFCIMALVAKRFHGGLAPLPVEELSNELSLPARITRDLMRLMAAAGILVEVFGDDFAFQPARALGTIRLSEIVDAVRNAGQSGWRVPSAISNDRIERVIESLDAKTAGELGAITLQDIVAAS
ncbi:MAG: YihY family inner membrane protein [Deltaproteobacteria bacterium]|nr:YihY family inner membrane protein [Deltaproteobacteria bacterium]